MKMTEEFAIKLGKLLRPLTKECRSINCGGCGIVAAEIFTMLSMRGYRCKIWNCTNEGIRYFNEYKKEVESNQRLVGNKRRSNKPVDAIRVNHFCCCR